MNIEFSTVGSANDSTFSKISSSITEGNSKMSSFTCYESLKALCFADILMAGDIFYAPNDIPNLVKTISWWLSFPVDKCEDNKDLREGFKSGRTDWRNDLRNHSKMVIFAITHRNKETFRLFENEIRDCHNIQCEFVPYSRLETMQFMFPCYFDQPRSDVRICFIKGDTTEK